MQVDKVKTLEEIRQLKHLLEAEKQEFLSVMSHELRTPMTGVKGYLSMILDGDAGEVPEHVKDYVAQAYVANDRLIRLVEKMVKIAEIQEDKFKFNISKVNLAREANQVVKDCQVRANDKKVSLRYVPSQEYFVKSDPDRTREIILTLVNNAIKFTPPPKQENGQSLVRGFTNVGGKIWVSHREANHWIITDVRDTGIGIRREDQERLFELFSKGNLTLTGQERGTGIGLYLARCLAEAQNGRLWLDQSELGKGSTFSLALPKY